MHFGLDLGEIYGGRIFDAFWIYEQVGRILPLWAIGKFAERVQLQNVLVLV